MLNEKQYITYLHNNFIKKNEETFQSCDEAKLTLRTMPAGLFDELMNLLGRVYENYGFDMQKMCAPNYNKFVLWQKNCFGGYNEEELLAAVKFIVFCCLSDKILDSPRFSDAEKECVCRKLNIDLFTQRTPFSSEMFGELDELLNDIRKFLVSQQIQESSHYAMIINKMRQAFVSEIYMYRNPLLCEESVTETELTLMVDKSVEFEIAAFLLAAATSIQMHEIKTAKCIANVFWLIDDLCDFVEDIKCKRKNSVLFYCTWEMGEMCLTERVEKSFQKIDMLLDMLEKNIFEIKQSANRDLYEYILNEIWEWCKGVRRQTE